MIAARGKLTPKTFSGQGGTGCKFVAEFPNGLLKNHFWDTLGSKQVHRIRLIRSVIK